MSNVADEVNGNTVEEDDKVSREVFYFKGQMNADVDLNFEDLSKRTIKHIMRALEMMPLEVTDPETGIKKLVYIDKKSEQFIQLRKIVLDTVNGMKRDTQEMVKTIIENSLK
jgi:hypothetical protein